MQINYSNSGIKTLRITTKFFFIASIVSSVIAIPFWGDEHFNNITVNWNMVGFSILALLTGFLELGLGYAIATIAENALLNKQIKERELLFEDKD